MTTLTPYWEEQRIITSEIYKRISFSDVDGNLINEFPKQIQAIYASIDVNTKSDSTKCAFASTIRNIYEAYKTYKDDFNKDNDQLIRLSNNPGMFFLREKSGKKSSPEETKEKLLKFDLDLCKMQIEKLENILNALVLNREIDNVKIISDSDKDTNSSATAKYLTTEILNVLKGSLGIDKGHFR